MSGHLPMLGNVCPTYECTVVYDSNELDREIKRLLQDDDVTKQKSVYEYLLSVKTKEKTLSIRAFTDNEKRIMYGRQGGICLMCAAEGNVKAWVIEEMHADHIIPWSRGGHTTLDRISTGNRQIS